KKLGILIDRHIREEFEHLDKFFEEIFPGKINATYEFIPVGDATDEVIASLDQGYDAIYYTALLTTDETEQRKIIDAINERKLPSFALFGRTIVELGVLAGVAAETNTDRLGRRVALSVQRILDDIDPGDISVNLEYNERFTINMATARQIDYSPDFSFLSEAELLNEEDETISRVIDIKMAIEEALESNWDLAIANKSIEAGEKNISQARSILLPQWGVGVNTRIIDEDRAISSFGSQPERLTFGSTSLSQLIYSEQATANVNIQKYQQEALEHSRDVTRLNIILEAATAYLNLMRTKTFERIQKENLRLTRRNLELEQVRQDVGFSGPSDLFRWESEIAFVKQDLNNVQALRKNAEIDLNRILNRPLDEPFRTVEVDLNDPSLLVYNPRFAPFITSPGLIKDLTMFLVEEGKRNLPELKQIAAVISAQERLQLLNKRLFYTPTIGFQAGFDYFIDRGGAGTMGLDLSGLGGPSISQPNDVLWNVGLQASFPLFTGLKRTSQYQQATLNLERIQQERDNLELLLSQRIRNAMEFTGASFANIQLSRDAAVSAVKNFALVQDAYAKGLASVVQLIDAQNASLNAQQLASNAGYEFVIDLLSVQRAVGEFKFLASETERDDYFDRLEEYMKKH
ncbi:MAG: TolC family protein, partial [Bacteroidetes bacterium]|nr:TolC family protein [Bacteroidota bacterium]